MTQLTMGFNKQTGLSLVELMVSLVISMAVVAGSVQVVTSSKRNFIDQDEVTFIQTNARYAIDLIARDIRMAGHMGCASPNSVMIGNAIDDSTGYISTNGIEGFEGSADTDDFPSEYRGAATVGTDSVIIRRASDANALDVRSHNSASAVLQLWQDHSFTKGTSLVIADASCRNIGLFQVSGPNSVPAGNIVHNTGAGTNNCTKIIKGSFSCDSTPCKAVSCGGWGKATGEYGPGSKILAFVANAYFVAESDLMPGMPALKRRALNTSGTSIEELAIGVEDFELVYGVDSDDDGSVDQYRSADNMDIDGSGSVTDSDWGEVLTVKISLVFRSQKEVLSAAETKTLAGTTYNDRYMRQLVNSTVRIRNRG